LHSLQSLTVVCYQAAFYRLPQAPVKSKTHFHFSLKARPMHSLRITEWKEEKFCNTRILFQCRASALCSKSYLCIPVHSGPILFYYGRYRPVPCQPAFVCEPAPIRFAYSHIFSLFLFLSLMLLAQLQVLPGWPMPCR